MAAIRGGAEDGPDRLRGGVDYAAVFRAGVTPSALVTPELVVADVNEAFVALAGRSREEIVGSELFELFPPEPGGQRGGVGPAGLRASALEVVGSGKPSMMVARRYQRFDRRTGSSQVRYFAPMNIPVFDERGDVAWILHRVEEVTDYMAAGTAASPKDSETAASALDTRTSDLVRRNRELALQASRDRTVSRILQEAMLTELPEPGHLQLAARYVANVDTDQVGGDWYDAAVLPDGATMVAVGDVVGHDITAAASMGQVRGLLRAVAWDRQEAPSVVLERVERAMSGLKIDTFATVILGRIEQTETDGLRRLRWSNAGHPPPLLVSEGGSVEVLETRNDLPLGAALGVSRVDHVRDLNPGSVLILYTDGLVERRDRSRDEGIGQLSETLRRHHSLPLERLLDEIITEVPGSTPEDDIAVLAVAIDSDHQT